MGLAGFQAMFKEFDRNPTSRWLKLNVILLFPFVGLLLRNLVEDKLRALLLSPPVGASVERSRSSWVSVSRLQNYR